MSAFGTGMLWYLHEDFFLNFTNVANIDLNFPEGVTLEDIRH